ncbi:N6-adenine-specific methylase [Legionella lansingensis]|uniref:Ribosomal RNA small subunit methyltransferase J n=1 Tax=Legionella lansingensis TaxID=45067 RepID=A0A0W0VJB5_9GAMM|nr:class I SAM-dependent methyltransferase [Legionella lansingensis]KTD20194.1 SAM-dependent methyltransferase [Legionella lansingensis]SNV48456.1 N6-adenine-specific methylase [Legionella lansingensis]
MIEEIAIGYENEEQRECAEQLAASLHLKVDNEAKARLLVMADKLALKIEHFTPLYADFSSTNWQKRRDAGKKQGLIRACKPKPGLQIIDVTAGWGRDAAVLASFGAEVIMLEREPIMAALLADALMRRDEYSKEKMNLKLYETDAFDYLVNLSATDYPDIIYIDPMHPERQKTALVKKDMQALQRLIKRDDKIFELLQLARTKVKKQVVVKWPQSLAPLLNPTSAIGGKTVRFDVYSI